MRWLPVSLICLLCVIGCSIRPVDQESLDMIEVERAAAPVGGYIGHSPHLYSTEGWRLSHYYEHGLPPRANENVYDRRQPQGAASAPSTQDASSQRESSNRHVTQRAAQETATHQQVRKRVVETRESKPPATNREAYLNQARRARQSAEETKKTEEEEELRKKEAQQRRNQRSKKRL